MPRTSCPRVLLLFRHRARMASGICVHGCFSPPRLLAAVVTGQESSTVFILVTFARAVAIVVVVIPLAIQLVTTWIVPVVAGIFAALVVAVTRTGLEW